MKPQKTTGKPKDPWLATRASHNNSPSTWTEMNKSNRKSQYKVTNRGGAEGTADQENSC